MMRLTDDYKHQGMRRKLMATLTQKGIQQADVLAAMETIPRHFFLDSQFEKFAYEDMAFKIGAGQTISQPYTVAFQTGLLQLSKGMKVLEIGTGSGYQTCVLLAMGVKVFSIERQRLLFDRTKALLLQMGLSPRLFFGDGYAGLPAYAPFDRILVTCGAPSVPQALLNQLKPGGSLVIPVGEGEHQTMLRILKKDDQTLEEENHGSFRFVPMLPHKSF
jgi:protein-L-isoaspartate(D-aspartate) O-methyltransferase